MVTLSQPPLTEVATSAPLTPGLYLVPTPIGNLKDITLRALDILHRVDLIACEDTRVSGKLLHHYGIPTKMLPYHEHNGEKMRPRLLSMIHAGKAIALISDAGTPLISDPGFKLVREVYGQNLYVTSLPGPSSVMTALTLSGFPTDHFVFAGFTPRKEFKLFSTLPYTLIFFSTANKLLQDLSIMAEAFPNRDVAVARELSKMFEEVQRGNCETILHHFTLHPPRGEIVIVLSPPHMASLPNEETINRAIEDALKSFPHASSKDLAAELSKEWGVSKRELYHKIVMKKEGV